MSDFNKLRLHIAEPNYDHAYWQQPLRREYQNAAEISRPFEGADTWGVRRRIHSRHITGSKSLPSEVKETWRDGTDCFFIELFFHPLSIIFSKVFIGICVDGVEIKRSYKRFPASERRRRCAQWSYLQWPAVTLRLILFHCIFLKCDFILYCCPLSSFKKKHPFCFDPGWHIIKLKLIFYSRKFSGFCQIWEQVKWKRAGPSAYRVTLIISTELPF